MRNTILWLLAVLVFIPALAKTTQYQQCTQLVQRNPSEALRLSEQWIQTHNHPSAFHCRALALFALKRYEQAAGALEVLSELISEEKLVLWGSVIRQASRSWQLAGDNAKAIITLSEAIQKTAEQGLSDPVVGRLSAELLVDRSQLYAQGGRDLFALQDLDQAISLSSDDPKLLFARAQLLAQQGETKLARRDLEHIATLNPDYPGARQLRSQLAE